MERQIGASLKRIVADRGYRGHNAPQEHKFRVYISGQKRRVTEQIKRELRRRSAVEPVIGHLKAEHRMGRNHLAHAPGDAINAVLAAARLQFPPAARLARSFVGCNLDCYRAGSPRTRSDRRGLNRVLHGRRKIKAVLAVTETVTECQKTKATSGDHTALIQLGRSPR